MVSDLLQQVKLLNTDAQLDLIEAVWNGLVSRNATPPLSAIQEAELDRRLDEHLANPDDVVSWDDVKAELSAHIQPTV
ncbi:MAG: addiction module protein [Burkholderiales bacterium]|nr:addiction module protein [Burkholderiales bacterium]